MYIQKTNNGYYDSDGQQHIRRGYFLLLIDKKQEIPNSPIHRLAHDVINDMRKEIPIKAIVRKVALSQCGHWMMGRARIYGHSITVRGSYGGDGLTCTVPDEVYDRASMLLPQRLYDLWNKGGGHNTAGSEAPAMREWANANLDLLTK